ncbi:ABC transporter permease [Albidovulum sp.]|uniref:ABC transporter permease n=1 Tax=Albidovulum sp. TaxID=1872424 RepID=UPI0039B93AE0
MNRRLGTFILALPGLVWWGLFLVTPVAMILAYAFFQRGTYGGVVPDFTFDNLARVFDPLYFRIFIDSARIATESAVIALLIGYPAAFAIARTSKAWQIPLLFLVILPFWSNYLIRTYAWIVLLSRTGVINNALMATGVIDQPLDMLYSEPAVIVGLVYNYLPFVVLTVYASIQRLNFELMEASEDLGAGGWTTFRRVILPLTLPGVAAGGVFVFVLSIGNFVTPDLLGGKRVVMIGNLVQNQFTAARDWPFGSALSLTLLTIMVGLLALQSWTQSRLRNIEGDHA